jgi:two-component system, NtrC family, response regulator AlgB
MNKTRILVVDDEPNILKTMTIGLKSFGYDVDGYDQAENALKQIDKDLFGALVYGCAFIDLMMHPMNGITLMKELHRRMPELVVIIITAHGTVETAVEALKEGAYDYLQKPFDINELEYLVKKVNKKQAVRGKIEKEEAIITKNEQFVGILNILQRIAKSELPIIIEGETGTGKELLADFVHRSSDRSSGPVIKLNCAAISEELFESELFGHIKGAFTGAIHDRSGKVEAANGGTLFLDEVGEMPHSQQAKLLRFLQNKEFQRIGENATRSSDVRIVSATNRNLEEAIDNGEFREDLFYRLSGFRVSVPPLRHRTEDILPIANHILEKMTDNSKTSVLSPQAEEVLLRYNWRGNVRELENVIVRAAILAGDGMEINLDSLPEYITTPEKRKQLLVSSVGELRSLEEVERDHVAYILEKTSSLEEAARILGIDTATLWRKRKKYGLG